MQSFFFHRGKSGLQCMSTVRVIVHTKSKEHHPSSASLSLYYAQPLFTNELMRPLYENIFSSLREFWILFLFIYWFILFFFLHPLNVPQFYFPPHFLLRISSLKIICVCLFHILISFIFEKKSDAHRGITDKLEHKSTLYVHGDEYGSLIDDDELKSRRKELRVKKSISNKCIKACRGLPRLFCLYIDSNFTLNVYNSVHRKSATPQNTVFLNVNSSIFDIKLYHLYFKNPKNMRRNSQKPHSMHLWWEKTFRRYNKTSHCTKNGFQQFARGYMCLKTHNN